MKHFPELADLMKLEEYKSSLVNYKTLGSITHGKYEYPIESIVIGPDDKTRPTLGLFGGVHGLERVGSQIILSFLKSLFFQMSWDKDLCRKLESYRIVCIPIVNPGGMARSTRSNLNDVDLMRNAPVEADQEHVFPLISGHRLSPKLPWYRGTGNLEKESEILINFVKEEMFPSEASIALDIHSGFGARDQIWYPYAKTKKDFPLLAEAMRLKALLDQTFPHHIYKFEAQSLNYLTHGDLWDYIFDAHFDDPLVKNSVFLPLTLELGSWSWIRKNPAQFFTKLGLFHPIKQHRHSRIMRRHILLLDFLGRAVRNHESWGA